ncbi:MAG: hypothetical protein ACK2T2_10250, partial [Anaerolineales bacterium]
MNPAITKLTKFLRLEAERGFDNRAVLGGLDRMLEPWQEEARGGNLPEPLIEAVTSRLRDYGRLSPKSRSEVLQGLWRRLQQEAPDLPELEFTAPAETADGAPDAEPAEKDISLEPSAAAEESPP